ncbi:MAG TPA: septum formation inhibitor Maf, partial [Campylobacterales bacterium]|nr:septum formation inhibitor Maf [Campylobacterales bacterium]
LELQSGSQISIISAMHYKTKEFYLCDVSATYYQFDIFKLKDLEDYLDSGLWDGKAGGCMVEGFCQKYIQNVDGYESTAMGLQVERLLGWLK